MILRLSQKMNRKIMAGTLAAAPLDKNPFADWSAHLFTADRTQYILVTNTKALYSIVMYGKGTPDESEFIKRVLNGLGEFMEADGQEALYRRFVAPASRTIRFAKALDRSVTGSMNDLVYHAKYWLTDGEHSPFDVGFKLNEIPFSALKYIDARDMLRSLAHCTADNA